MNTRITLNASEAKEYGLVHEIKPELFESGSALIPIDPVSAPIVQGTTLNESPQTGTYFPEAQQAMESGTVWDIADWIKPHPIIPTYPS